MSWSHKLRPTPASFALAPDWYLALKAQGASPEAIHAAVRHHCEQAMPGERVDDALVELMLLSYES